MIQFGTVALLDIIKRIRWAGHVAEATYASKERRKRSYEELEIDDRITLKLIYLVQNSGRKP
jgi:hypothetical protein